MVQIKALGASVGSFKEHYLARQEEVPVIVELKQAVRKELNCLKNKKSIGKEDLYNIPLSNGTDYLTRKALKSLNERLVV